MKQLVLIFFFLFGWQILYSQQAKDEYSKKVDSFSENTKDKIDSLNLNNLGKDFFNKANSLNDSVPTLSFPGKVDSIRLLLENRSDSLQDDLQEKLIQQKLDSMTSELASRIDSLRNLSLPDEKVKDEINSLSSLRDSLNNTVVISNVKEAEKKLNTISSQASEKITAVESKINEKLSLFSENGGNMPGNVNLGTRNLELPSSGLSPSTTDLKMGLSVPDNPLNGIDVSSGDLSLPQGQFPQSPDVTVPQAPELKIPEINGMDKVSEIQSKASEFGEATKKINDYKEDVNNLAKGNPEKIEQLSKDLESKVEGMDAVTELQKYDDMVKRYQDPQVMKEEALNKAKEMAVNHFIGHEEELKAAMEQFAKVRSKIPDPEGVYDMLKKQSNPHREKSFKERLLPGLALQFQKPNSLWVDFNPHVTYKLSGRFNVGVGWNQRIAYDTKQNEFDEKNRIYGVRSFIHFKVKSGLWLKGDIESMRAWVPSSLTSVDQGGRSWVWSYFGGIKKDFQFSKYVLGNVQVLYNLYDPDDRSPYANPINVRIGVEFPLNKKDHKK